LEPQEKRRENGTEENSVWETKQKCQSVSLLRNAREFCWGKKCNSTWKHEDIKR
jgi:hypothetical protein